MARVPYPLQTYKPLNFRGKQWSRRLESNQRPAVYETAALPTELRRQGKNKRKVNFPTDDAVHDSGRYEACQ